MDDSPSWLVFVGGALGVSLVTYLGGGGLLHYWYYLRGRKRAGEWKCQQRWLSPALSRHALALGTFNMVLGSIAAGSTAHYLVAGHHGALYFDLRRHGLGFSLATALLLFLLTDAGAYYMHRVFHSKRLFPFIHKWHHRYTIPNAFTVAAMHPLEWFVYQVILYLPAFFIPVHAAAYVALLLYYYYFGMIDHSGIKLRSIFPWQPPTQFHDDHHKYFHCNFGQNTALWDRLHGTIRRLGRRYGEQVFGGRGAPEGNAGPGRFVEYRDDDSAQLIEADWKPNYPVD